MQQDVTLLCVPELARALDPSWRAAPALPLDGLAETPRPAALLLPPRCDGWLDAAAPDPDLVCLVLLPPHEDAPLDPRVDDVVTPAAARDEVVMRARRALARKRSLATPPGPRAEIDGVRWGERFVTLSAAEARVAARLLERAHCVVGAAELAAAAYGETLGTRRGLQAHVYRLRRKLRPLDIDIQTVRQRGVRATFPAPAPAGRPRD